jgi:hypothetical protein
MNAMPMPIVIQKNFISFKFCLIARRKSKFFYNVIEVDNIFHVECGKIKGFLREKDPTSSNPTNQTTNN